MSGRRSSDIISAQLRQEIERLAPLSDLERLGLDSSASAEQIQAAFEKAESRLRPEKFAAFDDRTEELARKLYRAMLETGRRLGVQGARTSTAEQHGDATQWRRRALLAERSLTKERSEHAELRSSVAALEQQLTVLDEDLGRTRERADTAERLAILLSDAHGSSPSHRPESLEES